MILCCCQELAEELHSCESKMAALEGKLQTITGKYNSPETAALARDLAVLRKKLTAAELKSAEVSCLDFSKTGKSTTTISYSFSEDKIICKFSRIVKDQQINHHG